MKKRHIPLLICLLLALCFALTGCGDDNLSKVSIAGTQDTAYTVHSNGGGAVQYGNYVYFINGYAGYEDAKGKQNTWPKVVKGGLYRAQLTGEGYTNEATGAKEFAIQKNDGAALEFVSVTGKDNTGKDTDVVSVQRIAGKRIGTSGYKQGGIFIYDNWLYFASPNNEKNKKGTVQTTKTDFYRMKLDGSQTERVYTTKKTGNEASAYAFYKYDDAVYLVAQDGTDLVSVRMGKKVGKKKTIAQNITSVLLPYSQTYYKGMNENTPDHFVYVLRSVTDKDLQKTGNVIEIMRPDGKSGGVYYSQGKTGDTLEAVRDGLLFYRTTDNAGNTLIKYDSLHDFFMGNDEFTEEAEEGKKPKTYKECELFGDKAYRAYYEDLADKIEKAADKATKEKYERQMRTQMSGTLLSTASASDLTATYCFRPGGEQSNLVYMLGVTSGGVNLYSCLNGTSTAIQTVYSGSATFLSVADEYMYFTNSEGTTVYRTRWDKGVSEKDESEVQEQVSDSDVTATNYNGDYCAGYVMYTGKYSGLADAYTFFKKVDGGLHSDALFVGTVLSAETLSAPSVSLKKRVLSWKAVDNAEHYSVYYQAADGNVVLLEKELAETSYTVDDARYGTYWVVANNPTNSVWSEPSNTVSYNG